MSDGDTIKAGTMCQSIKCAKCGAWVGSSLYLGENTDRCYVTFRCPSCRHVLSAEFNRRRGRYVMRKWPWWLDPREWAVDWEYLVLCVLAFMGWTLYVFSR